MARRKKTNLPKSELNVTSMLDLVLNLIVFFVLISNFAMADLPPLEPPRPEGSRAYEDKTQDKIRINVVPDDANPSQAQYVKIGQDEIATTDMRRMTEVLQREYRISEQVVVDLRADYRIRYSVMQDVMKAITDSGITTVNIVAMTPDDKPGE